MPSNLPSSFASAAAGQNAGRDNKHGARGDGRGSNSGEWSRQGRSTNGTLTFRRTSTTPSSQSQQLPSSDTLHASGDPSGMSGMTAGSSSTGSTRYSRDDLLDIAANIPEVSSLFAPGWQPGQINGSAGRGWGKSPENHPAPQEPDVCWDNTGSVRPVGMADMTSEERELFSSDVNSILKPPAQNKDNNHSGGGPNGRKTSVSQGGPGGFGVASPSSSRPGARRRETTDTNPYGGGGLASPTSATRAGRDDWSFARRTNDLRDSTFDEAAGDGPSDVGSKPNPFGSLLRQNTTPSLGNISGQSPWGAPQGNQGAGVSTSSGGFGNFALPSSTIGDKRPQNMRGESRLAHLIPKDSSDAAGTKQAEPSSAVGPDLGRSWRARPRTDTDPFGVDENLSGSAVLGGAQDSSPPPMGNMRNQMYDTPVKGSAGDFGMSGLNLGSHGDQDNAPLSPSETNPYRSPPGGDRGEHDEPMEKPQGFAALPEHLQGFSHRPFGQAGFDGSDRSQTSSVGAKAYPPLGNLTAWPSSGTPDRDRGGAFPGFGGSLFGTVGDIQSPSLGNLGSVFGPASTPGLTGSGSLSRGSKLGSLFPPAMQAQMQSQEHDNLSDSMPDLRHGNPLGAIGRNPIGEHRETESPLRTNRGIFGDMFSHPDGTRTPSSDPMLGGLPSTSQAFTPISGAPPFAVPPSNDPPSAQARTMVMPDRMRWVYLDPQGQQQGPFTGLEMNDWYKAQFFTPNLRVKKLEDPEFEPLGQLIRRIGNSREPFLVPQIGIPHGPPTQSGPFSPGAGGVIQPPLVGAFPSFGRTLTAEEQNNLERRKQEEQYLMARQREFLSNQQSMSRVQMQGVPGLQHHSSAHSLQSQPSFGSITSPVGMHPQTSVGAIGSGSFFGEPGAPQAAASSSSGPNFGMFREEDLAQLSDQDRQIIAGLQGPGNAIGQQPIGAPPTDAGIRGQLPGTDDLLEDEEGFRGRLQEFEQLRAQRDAQQASDEQFGSGQLSVEEHELEDSSTHTTVHDTQGVSSARQQESQRIEANESAQRQYQQAQAAAVAAKLSGLPMPFPPPQSGSPLPAPAPQRVKSNLPEQYATASRSGTPDVIPSSATTQAPSLAPWAKDNGAESQKGPSLKDIQAAEAAKAAKAEEQATLARQVMLKSEAAREREKAAAVAPGLPTSSTWGTASPLSAGPTGSPWAKPSNVKGPAPGPAATTTTADKKKTLADIQREEEARKVRAEKAAAAAAAANATATQAIANAAAVGKRYADLANKTNASPISSSAAIAAGSINAMPAGWATVGANGKAKVPLTIVPAAAPAAPAQPRAVSTTVAKPVVAAPPKPVLKSNTSSLGSARSEAAEEFNKWLVGQCKRGITSADAQIFAANLVELPLDAALIADAVYANSTVLDGRWFAQEFIRRKKLADKGVVEKQPTNSPDGQSGSGWSEVAKKSSYKEVTEQEAAPVSAPGFKVVPARKKGKK
ncbi:PERQ amino acid-rich with GYF domain-containing protein [Microdochium nivale]|nr:PERQ amino acid-rich with GYF domain-containing protein [Microdochium nivale]